MTNKLENQSQNQLKNKKITPVKYIESLRYFHASLKSMNSVLEEVFHQINIDSTQLEELQKRLSKEGVLWRFEDFEDNLKIILLLAGVFDKPQYLQFENRIVELSTPRGDPYKT